MLPVRCRGAPSVRAGGARSFQGMTQREERSGRRAISERDVQRAGSPETDGKEMKGKY